MRRLTPEKLAARISPEGIFYGDLFLGGYDSPLPENLVVVRGRLNLSGYRFWLPGSLRLIDGDLDLSGYNQPLPTGLAVVSGDLELSDYGFPLPSGLTRVGGSLHGLGDHDFALPSSLESIGGDIGLGYYAHRLPPTLKYIGGNVSFYPQYDHPLPQDLRIGGEDIGWNYKFPMPRGYKREHYEIEAPKTAEFARWFSGSKAVDRSGDPAVLYHGTASGGFSAFDLAKIASHHPGFYFSDEITVAGSYIPKPEWPLQDPTPALGMPDALDVKGAYRVFLSLRDPAVVDCKGQNWDKISDPDFPGLLRTHEIAAEAKRRGHDSVVFLNLVDHGQMSGRPQIGTVYVAFEPTQIKSALFNTGEYSPTDPDIRKNPRRTSRQPASSALRRKKTSRRR